MMKAAIVFESKLNRRAKMKRRRKTKSLKLAFASTRGETEGNRETKRENVEK